MTENVQHAVAKSIEELDHLRKVLRRKTVQRVRSADELALIRTTAYTWFNDHRSALAERIDAESLKPADDYYRGLLFSADRSTTRSSYFDTVKKLRRVLAELRTNSALLQPPSYQLHSSSDAPLDFSPLVGDQNMREILETRWNECSICVQSNASLAATVMMGGLLEGLLLARVNVEPDCTSR